MKKANEINLTPEQIKMADALANPEIMENKTELCAMVGISRTTFYEWLKKKEFTSYVALLIDKYTDAELGTVWKALVRRCESGDVSAIKLYFELKGKYKQKLDLSGEVVFLSGEDKLE